MQAYSDECLESAALIRGRLYLAMLFMPVEDREHFKTFWDHDTLTEMVWPKLPIKRTGGL
jgi:hypothetical protein